MRTRVLYWFRTPPGVRVGRSALDEAAIRCIEESNPDVEFDWTKILNGQGAPEPVPMPALPPRRAEPERRAGRRPVETRPPAPLAVAVAAPPVPQPPAGRELPARRPEPAFSTPASPEPAMELADLRAEVLLRDDMPMTAAHGRLGPEGLLRLRARYAEMLARITERVPEPERRDELKSEAERLNPDTWVTDAEVTAGLEAYEAVLESLRGVVGQGRRRRRRGGQGREAEPDEASAAACAAEAAADAAPAAGQYEPASAEQPPEPV
jgi:hypothetical protein